jgi:signal transduction histidine kinase
MGVQRTAGLGLVALAVLAPPPAAGAELGTAQEAKAMLVRAIAAVKADKRSAIDKFNRNDPGFRDRDLFVFCFDARDGTFTAHEALVAQDVRRLRDLAGKPFGEELFAAAKEGQVTQVSYLSRLPGSTQNVTREAYVMRAADQVCGVSAYRDALHGN